jgi:CDP-diacylglycerol--glycerol-3-phosphate 3-phosphatidyltransferase
MKRRAYYLVNSITAYRVVAFLILAFLLYNSHLEAFRWLLGLSFFTDLIDGFLARKLKVQSAFGARLDSIGDDLTVLAGLIGVYVFKKDFLNEQKYILGGLVGLFLLQTLMALLRYGKTTSFHTYLAKTAAIFQGSFLILLFFLDSPPYILYYAAVLITFLELTEEIIITLILPDWKTDIKGLYWVIKHLKQS